MSEIWDTLLAELDEYHDVWCEPIPKALERLSDDQVRKLEDALCQEGLRRGFSRWWWE